ncbi:8069_t:CDS:2 [Dentiscutata erythropus]|uniref:8069_t:CDS:1 n=1 Tax=Dentiscutata erythropus TaxID=1348616 RepID=A0A9N8Z211_9GLOM|nr:8069_t:CDS:2 [Dentiscutata erythropus]
MTNPEKVKNENNKQRHMTLGPNLKNRENKSLGHNISQESMEIQNNHMQEVLTDTTNLNIDWVEDSEAAYIKEGTPIQRNKTQYEALVSNDRSENSIAKDNPYREPNVVEEDQIKNKEIEKKTTEQTLSKSVESIEKISDKNHTQNKQSQAAIQELTETLPDSTIVDQEISNLPEEEFILVTRKKRGAKSALAAEIRSDKHTLYKKEINTGGRYTSKHSGKVIANLTILSHEQK